jgi:micrococcal nuclease
MNPSLFSLRRFRWGILSLALVLLAGCTKADGQQIEGKVLWIYDGDTIKIAGVGPVRLIGIDTPERKNSERDRYFRKLGIPPKKLRRIARDALNFNIATVKGQAVRLCLDHEERDGHGRLLAYVTLPDGKLLNRLLIERGFAVVYRRFDFRLKEDFLLAEVQARKRGIGLWEK